MRPEVVSDEKMASGGNDNKLFVWAINQAEPTSPICRFTDHVAAVKAVAWSPHQNGLLASGGGTADRKYTILECQHWHCPSQSGQAAKYAISCGVRT